MMPDFASRSRFGVSAAALCQPTLFQPTSCNSRTQNLKSQSASVARMYRCNGIC